VDDELEEDSLPDEELLDEDPDVEPVLVDDDPDEELDELPWTIGVDTLVGSVMPVQPASAATGPPISSSRKSRRRRSWSAAGTSRSPSG
jgi:hypothetical protein